MPKSQPVVLSSRPAGPAERPVHAAGFLAIRTVGPWSDIDPAFVEEGGGFAPVLPLELLPPPWPGWIADTARGAGAPADYVMQSLLASVAGLCGGGAIVRVTPSWCERLVLWQALVGRRSSGKSPALAPLRGLLDRLEAEPMEGTDQRAPPLVVTDGDAAALPAALAARPQGVLLWRDEASSWFADLPDDATAVSVLGSMRPDDLMEALADGRDSFAGRFLYAWPDPPPYCRLVDRRPPDNARALALLRRIGRAAGTPDEPLVLAFDEAATKAFDDFLAGLHLALRSAEGVEADWMGKGSGAVARLAGILALLAWAGSESARDSGRTPGRIGAPSVQAAARLWNDYFRPHANLVFDRAGPSDLQRQARRVVRWLKANGRPEVTREDVRRHALCRTVNAARADSVIGRLWSAGVLRPAAVDSPPQGGRPPHLYEVNPALGPALGLGPSGGGPSAGEK